MSTIRETAGATDPDQGVGDKNGLTNAVETAVTVEQRTRGKRWRVFQWTFIFTCAAICLDLITTYFGFQRAGAKFEQNGIALFLIQHLGWPGITLLLFVICLVCLASFKLVYWNLSLSWSRWLNLLVAAVCLFRWLVVVTDTLWLFQR